MESLSSFRWFLLVVIVLCVEIKQTTALYRNACKSAKTQVQMLWLNWTKFLFMLAMKGDV